MISDLEWNVFAEDINANQIKIINIFKNGSYTFIQDLLKHAKEYKKMIKCGVSIEEANTKFEEEVMASLMHSYWCRCEWEIIISSWPPTPKIPEVKVDIYTQIRMNKDKFIKYLIDNIDLIKEKKK